MKIISKIISLVFIIALLIGGYILYNNKTFFKEVYIGVQKQEIFIPKYSFFKEECCMTAATFYSLKSEKSLKEEIDKYMKTFVYFEDESTHGYKKGDLFIQEYNVIDNGIYRKIVIVY